MINWSRVTELQEDLGVEDFEEITSLFLEEVEEKLGTLINKESDSIADDLHFIKGSAANLGFEELRALCEHMENDMNTAPVEDLVAVYQQSKIVFFKGIPKQSVA